MIIFDCNGVLVDSEPIAMSVAAEELQRVGLRVTPEIVARYFTGRRPADMFADVEAATGIKLPPGFAAHGRGQDAETAAQRSAHHAACGACPDLAARPESRRLIVAARSRAASLECTDLMRFFEPNVFSASYVAAGKPAPDLFLHVAASTGIAPADCIVVEDSPAGVSAAVAAGMTAIGFVGGGHAALNLGSHLTAAGAKMVIADMRALKGAVVALRGII